MKASLFAQMGYAERHRFPATWPVPPGSHDPAVTMQSYAEGLEECELAEEMGFEWISCSEHHYSDNRLTPNPAVMAAAIAQRCKKARIALLGPLLQHHNPIRAAEEIGMLDNLTGGRLIVAFLRGTPGEDLPYGMNPAEGRARLLEGMALVLRALTEPQPFAWEGRYYQFRTVAVWPRPVQQPLPPALVATRSDDAVRYAAAHRLGLAVSYEPVDQMAQVTDKYYRWCQEAGWQPTPDQVVYRASILVAETDRQAEQRLEALKASGLGERGLDPRSSVTQAVFAARNGRAFGPHQRNGPAGDTQRARQAVQSGRGLLTLVGGPDTIVKQLKAFHDRCGVGVVDLGFQQTGTTHREVMHEIALFGKEVLPRIKEF
jgi:alkanesulfonate monooxygenase SsuD/methylene tetrahydromethanopterin reductase-like flavin-dependent oxidoreductase (luciferase family)